MSVENRLSSLPHGVLSKNSIVANATETSRESWILMAARMPPFANDQDLTITASVLNRVILPYTVRKFRLDQEESKLARAADAPPLEDPESDADADHTESHQSEAIRESCMRQRLVMMSPERK